MNKMICVRMTEALRTRIATAAVASDLSFAGAARALIERGLSAPASNAAELPAEVLETLTALAEEQARMGEQQAQTAARIQSLSGAVARTNETLRDLTLAVQKLYQPAAPAGAAVTGRQSAGQINLPPAPPPNYAAWAAQQGKLEHETRETRIVRLKAEYQRQFGVAP